MPVAAVDDTAESALTVTEESIDAYAELTGDDNPIHLDDDYAGETFFGGRVAHGMFTAGAVSAALADLPGDIVYLSQDLTFENPVRPGQTVTASAIVVEELGDDKLRVETVAEADGEQVLSGEAVVMSVPHES
ncbi:MaoC family dehydratase [Halorussus halophilus]|uniref:MaoC family dehydratase n=1 Tax=Halorussus halophilus TaxID=2650975 RepID=UPI0013012EF5|nr:MaoC family dehydratase [Halorussus halophilus]